MRKLTRLDLTDADTRHLQAKTNGIVVAADQKAEAARLWKNKNRMVFGRVRRQLETMAGGRARCMYCEDSLGTDIDHFQPKKTHPSSAFRWSNYLLACSHCNSNLKRSSFPTNAAGQPLLIDPTIDDPSNHLRLDPVLGELTSRSVEGNTSINVFGLNREHLIQGRSDAWLALEVLIRRYARLRNKGEDAAADLILATVQRTAFGEVHVTMSMMALSGMMLLPKSVRKPFMDYPELRA